MKKRSVLNSPRLNQIKRARYVKKRNKILLYSFLIIIFLAGVIALSRWQEINISEISISGNKVVETEDIKKIIESDLSGRYLFAFPKKNFAIYPKKKIKEDLSSGLRRLKDIKLSVKDTKTLEVEVSERKPSFTWCGDSLPEGAHKFEENKCYFMDEGGYIFAEAPYFSGEVYFRFIGKIRRPSDSPFGFIFLPGELGKLVSFKDEVLSMGIKPASFFVKDDGDIELYLSSDTAPPDAPKILFKRESDYQKLAENLQAALGTDPLKTDIDKKYSQLLYIDLRFGNKVYFKFK